MPDKEAYGDDLYGDLDLEDLETSGIEEELEDPPDMEPHQPSSATAASTAVPAAAGNTDQALPAAVGYQQGAPGGGNQQYGFGTNNAFSSGSGQGQGGGEDQDRFRPSDAPDEGKMFIGGLNWETTDDGLRAYMGQFGDIAASTIMRDPSGRSRGFAFLTYSDPASVNKVMNQTHMLDGKQIDPKRAIPRAEHERTAKVFVGGLAATVTGDSLKAFLSQFGQVMDATVMYDRETTRSKGFAFATFADEDSVGRAMENSGMELEGKQIEIKKAQPRGAGTQPKSFGAKGNFNQGNNVMGGGMSGGMGSSAGGGFDPNAMAMMYQNMMKNNGMGNMGMSGGFDPNAMAMMYQNMMKSMTGMNAPAINPNMAMRNMGMGGMGGMAGMGNMGMMGMGNMGTMGMGGMGMGNMGMMGMGNMGNMGNMGFGGNMAGATSMRGGSGNMQARPIPNAPRGPAAMRQGQSSPNAAGSGVAAPMQGGTGAQRYSTQGSSRAKPY